MRGSAIPRLAYAHRLRSIHVCFQPTPIFVQSAHLLDIARKRVCTVQGHVVRHKQDHIEELTAAKHIVHLPQCQFFNVNRCE